MFLHYFVFEKKIKLFVKMQFINPYFCVFTGELPSYEEFYKNVLSKNVVCLLDQQLTDEWDCRKSWVTNDGLVNLDFLKTKYGDKLCPVYNCNKKYYDSNPKEMMPMKKFIDYWKTVISRNYNYEGGSLDVLYLKDWHMFQEIPGSEDVYKVPSYFKSDYLNEYCLANKLTDYRFVYFGPKKSHTPLHVDVFGSFSWSANICGLKKWLIIPQKNVKKLKQLLPTLPADLYTVSGHEEILKQVEAFEITQKCGQTVFVPSGYMHQVLNAEDTISINHNWINAANLSFIYDNIIEAHKQVQKEIGDLKATLSKEEWQENCQKILAMHFGINLTEFLKIISHIASRLEKESTKASAITQKFRFEHDVDVCASVASKIRSNDQFESCWNQADVIQKQLGTIKHKKLAKLL